MHSSSTGCCAGVCSVEQRSGIGQLDLGEGFGCWVEGRRVEVRERLELLLERLGPQLVAAHVLARQPHEPLAHPRHRTLRAVHDLAEREREAQVGGLERPVAAERVDVRRDERERGLARRAGAAGRTDRARTVRGSPRARPRASRAAPATAPTSSPRACRDRAPRTACPRDRARSASARRRCVVGVGADRLGERDRAPVGARRACGAPTRRGRSTSTGERERVARARSRSAMCVCAARTMSSMLRRARRRRPAPRASADWSRGRWCSSPRRRVARAPSSPDRASAASA